MYTLVTTGPDPTIPYRPLYRVPHRLLSTSPPIGVASISNPRGIRLYYKVWRTYSGSGSPPDEAEPAWSAATAGLFEGASFNITNGRTINIHVAFAGRLFPYQITFKRRDTNSNPIPSIVTDSLETWTFDGTAGPHVFTYTSPGANQRIEGFFGLPNSQLNFYD